MDEVIKELIKLGEDLSECLYQCAEYLPIEEQELIRVAKWKALEISDKIQEIEDEKINR
jgi:hypothetical protein